MFLKKSGMTRLHHPRGCEMRLSASSSRPFSLAKDFRLSAVCPLGWSRLFSSAWG